MKLLLLSFLIPHILKDSESTIVGGAAVQWKSWINGFIRNGHHFGILTFSGAQDFIGKKLEFDLVESYNPEYGISRLRVIYYQIPKLIFTIKKYKPDYLIQGAATSQTGILMIIAKLLKIPFVHRIANDPDVDERIYKMVHKREIFWYKLGVKYADFIFAQNSYQYNKLKEKYPQKKIFVLHNPFELGTEATEIKTRTERHYIAWVANFRYMKNMPELLKIVKKLPNVEFKIAGKKHRDADAETVKALEALEKLNNVEFVGYLKRTEIKPFFLKAVALLNTSHFEGFSNTFLEAWSCGVPVVSTKNVNPDEIITKNNLGRVAEDYRDLENCINSVLDLTEQEYNDLSFHCHNYVKEYHDPRVLAQKFVQYLENNKY
jgi:glycosyltransferase involved in cell wall biosynthesis